MITETKDFGDVESMLTYADKYFRDYDPRGYGTVINLSYDMLNNRWIAMIERYESYESCD